MKKQFLLFGSFIIYFSSIAQTQIQSSDIWFSGNNTVVGNSGSFLEPYSGFNSQNNQSIQLYGRSINYGIPTFSFVKSYHGHDYGGSLTWVSDNFQTSDKRFAQIGANLNNGEGSLNFYTRSETDSQGQFNVMTMDKSGNIGMGTSSPQTHLELVGGPYFTPHESNAFVIRYSNSSSTNDNRMLGMTITLDGSNDVHSSSQKSVGIFAKSASGWSNNVDMLFYTRGTNQAPYFTEKMRIRSNGSVGIGTTTTGTHKLAVEGTIGAREIKVEASGWSDFVFEKDYELRTLEEVEQHIKEKGHLPEIPSEPDVTENGINLGEMDAKLLQKIEELTLYVIDMNKRVGQLEKENGKLKNEISTLKNE